MARVDDELASGHCPRFQVAIELIGRRWSGAILVAMGSGASRFTEIRARVPGLSDRLLADRLRELEGAGLLEREVAPEVPVQVRYRLTAGAEELLPIARDLARWADRWLPPGRG